MNIKGPFFFSILIIGVFVASYLPNINMEQKESVLMQTILGGVKQLHYSPDEINDSFSNEVYDLYIDRIDSGRRWFTTSDLAQLEEWRSKIDDGIVNPNYDFFDLSIELKKAGLKKAESFYKDLLAQPFDFTKTEDVELDGDKKEFANNDAELKEYWRKNLKYDVMNNLSVKLEKQEKALKEENSDVEEEGEKKEPVVIKSKEELEIEARKDVLERYEDWFARLNDERRSDYLSHYLNAITNVFDPHTSYYLPKDKENFDINMSGTLEGIGARLQTQDEYTKVISIVPGGPAWKGKELEVEDLIMKVTQGEGADADDVTDWRIDDVVAKIRGKKGTDVILTVKKVDGSIKDVKITRDVVILDEGYAKSAIMNYEGIEDVGYIKLPRFYADFNRKGGKSCFVDVAKEIEKLNARGVSGIILDLRNNGGGSLRDVVKMSGLFIEEGPIVQVKSRDRKPEVLEDEDPRVQYDGPLIVMVNQFSASASEILAAAMQDYKRAVIVGTKSTFGKGTVQRFYDLDNAIRGNDELKPLGEVKLTIQKFYRVNGGSTQLRGVTPDIILPDNFTYIKTGEQDHEHAMEWSEIPAVTHTQKAYKLSNLQTLKKNSENRIASSEVFQKVLENASRLKRQQDKTTYPLNFEVYQKLEKEIEEEAAQFKDIFKPIEKLKIENLAVDLELIKADESKSARNEDWIESLNKDSYIEETLLIMKDMVKG